MLLSPFVALLNLGIFSFFNELNGFRTLYLSNKFLLQLQYFWQGLSPGAYPRAGRVQQSEKLFRGLFFPSIAQ